MESRDDPRWGGWISSYFVGAASSSLSTVLTFPIYKTIFRQQLHTLTIRAATCQLSKEGVKHLYRGLTPPLMAKTVQGTLIFGTQGSLQHFFSKGGTPGAKICAFSGCLSGAIETVLLVPFERIQNILQDGRNNVKFPNTRSIVQELQTYKKRQWLTCGLYRGFTIILVRNMVGSAIFLSCKDPLRDVLTYPGLPIWASSLGSGALNGALTSLALYPLSVIIANMQAEVGNNLPHVRKVALRVWKKCGGRVSMLYRGASLIILRSCITWGVTNSIHDTLSNQLP
ncbi:solute carrier family 25 member 53 [Bufo gargarizans]|uniref:solute carrier family 25 member 53 n=1 Tax=Bufo gargarizans TaxID=30331 RepID=UPI001CF1054C|nr:solute carrier family 25 member 53 [Bufo gargarizans]